MDTTNIIFAVVSLGSMGALFGLILGFAGKIFAVPVDEKVPMILEVLPGANCGGCGFAGCAAYANAVAEGTATVNGCPVGGPGVAQKIGEIMGVTVEAAERKVAVVKCYGTTDNAALKFNYAGIEDCKALAGFGTGNKECGNACLGMGNCVTVCKFDAITVENGVAVVNRDKCTACGACVTACPKHVISLMPFDSKVEVMCSSTDKGAVTRANCKIGCIACGLCVKNCPSEAIVVENNLAKIDYSKCTGCGICVEKCPRKIIKVL